MASASLRQPDASPMDCVEAASLFLYTCSRLLARSTPVTPAQVRMARAAVNWSLDQLAQAAGVHRNTIHNFETGRYSGSPEKLRAVRQALQNAGVEFIGEAESGGVRLRKPNGSAVAAAGVAVAGALAG